MRLFTAVGFASMIAAAGCATVQTTRPGTVGVTRSQQMLVTVGDVNSSAAHQYSDLLNQARGRNALNRNQNQVRRVRRIANRLISQTRAFRPDAPNWQWEVNVISSREVNAFCMPGGKIVIYTGFLNVIEPTDDELAALLGHEIAHALREHGRERISERITTGIVLDVAGSLLGLEQDQELIAQLLTQVMFTLPNSRQHEQEADRIGVELAARAGYDPSNAASLWQKMSQRRSGGLPEFLSTHPSPATRVRDLQQYGRRVMPLYSRSVRNSPSMSIRSTPVRQPQQRLVTPIHSTPQLARLSVGSLAPATIFVNGQRSSSNPIINHSVQPGLVHLRFEVTDTTGTWTKDTTVTLTAGEERNVGRLSLTRPAPKPTVEIGYLSVGTRPLATIFINGERIESNPLIGLAVRTGPIHLRFEVTDSTGTWSQELTLTLSPNERRNLGRITLVRN